MTHKVIHTEKALACFQAQPDAFDMVITDQTMPGLTGEELALAILSLRPDMPIILCTGYSALINEEKAKERGIQGFILKPVTTGKIAGSIRQLLDTEK